MSPILIAAILGAGAFAFVAFQRRGQQTPASPIQAKAANVIDLDAIDALAKREAAALISARIVANAAAKHVAEHSAASATPTSTPPPSPPKE